MPPGTGKALLRCSIPLHLHAVLKAEAEARRVDIGDVLEGRLDLGPVHAPVGMPLLLKKLEVLQEQQQSMLMLLEQLISAVAGPAQDATTPTDDRPPMATYADLYQPPGPTPSEPPTSRPERRRTRWPFSPGSRG